MTKEMQLPLRAVHDLPLKGCHKAIGNSTCMADIEQIFLQDAHSLGFDFVNYSFVQSNDEDHDSPNLNVSFTPVFSNYPDGWMNTYAQEQLYDYDAVLRTLEYMPINQNLSFGTWSKAEQQAVDNPLGENQRQRNFYTQQVMRVFAKAREFNLNSGIYIIHRAGPVQTMISMASTTLPQKLYPKLDNDGLWNHLLALTILTNHAITGTRGCDQCNRNVRLYGIQEIVLTSAQKEVLRLYAEKGNSTLKDIALAHGTSVDTIKYHLKSVRGKFNRPRLSGYALARFAVDHNLI